MTTQPLAMCEDNAQESDMTLIAPPRGDMTFDDECSPPAPDSHDFAMEYGHNEDSHSSGESSIPDLISNSEDEEDASKLLFPSAAAFLATLTASCGTRHKTRLANNNYPEANFPIVNDADDSVVTDQPREAKPYQASTRETIPIRTIAKSDIPTKRMQTKATKVTDVAAPSSDFMNPTDGARHPFLPAVLWIHPHVTALTPNRFAAKKSSDHFLL